MKLFKNNGMLWVFISISLWLILTSAILVVGARVQSSSKDAVLKREGPVPPSAPSSCTLIGGGDGSDDSPCPPATHQ
ncbi:hypothetical protein PVL29_017377 [Vitis rotundifolia]|uniref:Uncharacterized protein n=1 Tax=Vitis rotundifolia TaxID=103349 RepID=A0AA38ZB58_VITRO|nr:hypothetical protein PVL29_017377 [Vitis rotundifolia]